MKIHIELTSKYFEYLKSVAESRNSRIGSVGKAILCDAIDERLEK